MDASDGGMCKGWNNSIDTLIIFAGLFSATVTAFTVESYQWLSETPADTLTRLQLRDRLNATHDPAIDHLAPATFNVSSASVAINTLWFASLTISLGVVIISILCKQWLYEYQRYDNFTLDEAFLIRGLRYRGLRGWKVPEIISSLPVLLQFALVLFLFGVLVLLWPLQAIVASITTIITGLTFFFLVITTTLPSIQYIFPTFSTQCAYKSSQSWSFFLFTAFWLFDFTVLTSWSSFDRWEVTRVYDDTGRTLSRVYKLLGNSTDAVLSIYSTLANRSLEPVNETDLSLLSGFVNGLDASRKQKITSRPDDVGEMVEHSRIETLKSCLLRHKRSSKSDWLPRYTDPFILRFDSGVIMDNGLFYRIIFGPTYQYYEGIHWTLSKVLESRNHQSRPEFFSQFIEHCALSSTTGVSPLEDNVTSIIWKHSPTAPNYGPALVIHLVETYSCLLKANEFNPRSVFPTRVYLTLMQSYHQHKCDPSPATLLKGIQDSVNRVPESDLSKKATYAWEIMCCLGIGHSSLENFAESHKSDLEKQYLSSFMRFFAELYEREDFLQVTHGYEHIETTLTYFRGYLAQNPDIPQ